MTTLCLHSVPITDIMLANKRRRRREAVNIIESPARQKLSATGALTTTTSGRVTMAAENSITTEIPKETTKSPEEYDAYLEEYDFYGNKLDSDVDNYYSDNFDFYTGQIRENKSNKNESGRALDSENKEKGKVYIYSNISFSHAH
jgi:hypothetical protein